MITKTTPQEIIICDTVAEFNSLSNIPDGIRVLCEETRKAYVVINSVPIDLVSGGGEQGIPGVDGSPGVDGQQGLPGSDGYTPIKDVDYFDGQNGDTGPQGVQGIPGNDGTQGIQGTKGDTGTAGAAGTPGTKGDTGNTGSPGTTDYTALSNKPDLSSLHAPGSDNQDLSTLVVKVTNKSLVTASLKFGLGFMNVTGVPTILTACCMGRVYNMS